MIEGIRMPPQWYLARSGQKHGPYSMEQLRHFAAAGQLVPTDMLLEDGTQKWAAASSLPGLFAATAIAAQPERAARAEALPRSAPSEEIQDAVLADSPDRYDIAAPALWNPNAAANWSLLFTPIFGSYLHAVNWRALGKPGKARANLVWMWLTVAFLIVNVVMVFVPDSKGMEALTRAAGLALLLGWYFSQGKSQAKYVKTAFPHGYPTRSWGAPIGIAVGAVAGYMLVVLVLAFVFYTPDAKDIVAEVKPLILQEWQKKPETRGATIQNITLDHKGGNRYSGFVDATLGGRLERFTLEVTVDGGTFVWELKPVNR
jgi:hypothetical protein